MYTKPTETADVVRGAETRKAYDRPKLTNLGKASPCNTEVRRNAGW